MQRLESLEPPTKSDDNESTASIYHNYLINLIKAMDPVQNSYLPHLYIIGDSHSLSMHNQTVFYKNTPKRCQAKWILGCKQFHLGTQSFNRYKYKFESIISSLPSHSTIAFIIGEIDARPNEGIIKALKKFPSMTPKELITQTIRNYIDYIKAQTRHKEIDVIICGIPAPNVAFRQDNIDEVSRYGSYVYNINYILKDISLKEGFSFLDLFSLTQTKERVADGSMHLDSTHLLPSVTPMAFERYLLSCV